MKNTAAWLLLVFSNACCFGQTLSIHVTGLRNTSGNLRIAFYNTAQSFDDEKALFVKTIPKSALIKNGMTAKFSDIKTGLYGIAVLDDENANEKMDYGFLLPEEGFGFSDYFHTGMKRPKFESFDFMLKDESKTVEIKLRYL